MPQMVIPAAPAHQIVGLMMNRRKFIQWSLASSLCINTGCSSTVNKQYFYTAIKKNQQYFVSAFDSSGAMIFETALPQRCHGGAINKINQHTAWAARSPGDHLYILDNKGDLIRQIQSDPGRHFYGHSQYSADGTLLYTTENNYTDGEGILSVRSVANDYQLINEFFSGGIGPHELAWLSDQIHLVIANGGLETKPDSNKILNLDSMQPSLSIMHSQTGVIKQQLYLPDPLLSIRHLSINSQDQLVVLTQYKGPRDTQIPLVYYWQPGQPELLALEPPTKGWLSFKQYSASASISNNGIAAITTPRGKQLALWNLNKRTFIKSFTIKDVAGIHYNPQQNFFIASNGQGELWAIDATNLNMLWQEPRRFTDLAFDNHMLFA